MNDMKQANESKHIDWMLNLSSLSGRGRDSSQGDHADIKASLKKNKTKQKLSYRGPTSSISEDLPGEILLFDL